MDASRMFTPPRPIALETWSAGTTTLANFSSFTQVNGEYIGWLKGSAYKFFFVFGVIDDIEYFIAKFTHDGMLYEYLSCPPHAPTASYTFIVGNHGYFTAVARFANYL